MDYLNSNSLLMKPLLFHPDSYMASRPNIRSGFGGNYRRTPDSYHSKLQPTTPIPPNFTSHSDDHDLKSPTDSNSARTHPPTTAYSDYSLSSNQMKQILRADELDTTIVIEWRQISEKEYEFDQKLLKLIEQLPADRQQFTGLILTSLDANSRLKQLRVGHNTKPGNDVIVGGLEFRLKEALQINPTNTAEVQQSPGYLSNEQCDQTNEPQLSDTDNKSEPVTTTQDDNLVNINNGHNNDEVMNDTTTNTITTTVSVAVDLKANGSINKIESDQISDDQCDSNRPSVINILRRLSRCLAMRIAHKRHELATVQEHMARNATEQNLLRYRLKEIPVDHYASHSSLSSSWDKLSVDPTQTTIVNRFDRWHINTTAVIQLLCQLARRLASIDAKMMNSQRRIDHLQQTNNKIMKHNLTTMKQTDGTNMYMEQQKLLEQRTQLMTQILEAQSLRSELELCRVRLLESIPIDVTCDIAHRILYKLGRDLTEHSTNSMHPVKQSMNIPYRPISLSDIRLDNNNNHDNDNKKLDMDATVTTTSITNNTIHTDIKTEYLRDRVARHLKEFLQWLIFSQIYETEIKVDQDLWQSIQDELRLEVSY